MSETTITQREITKAWEKATGERHSFELTRYFCYVLEVHDVHFNTDSPVLLPDRATEAGGGDPDPAHLTGLAVLQAAYEQSRNHPNQKVIILGHTDTRGSAQYNVGLSQQRSDNVRTALSGDREGWINISKEKHKVEDYQLILKWACDNKGWDCDPGPIDNKDGTDTREATRKFQQSYNAEFKKTIKEDGVVGKDTWGAFFDLYMQTLQKLMDTDEIGLTTIQQSLKGKFLDGKRKAVGCGEYFPIDEKRKDNYRSVKNRRVEILFFDPGHEPKLDCHPAPGQCLHKKCEINNPIIYEFRRIDPKEIISPIFRVSLRMGSIEELFPNPPDTTPGRMERLQVLGFFYLPMKHKLAETAFNGGTLPGGVGPAVTGAWAYFKTRVLNNADDATADQEIQKMLKERIIDKGILPSSGPDGGAPGEANFARIRIPGGYTFMGPFGLNLTSDPGYPADWPTADTYTFETLVRRDNPVLGKIPLVAFVERQNASSGNWAPAPGSDVYFQLIPSYDLPDFDPARPPGEQFNRPPVRESTVGPVAPPAGANGPVATGMGPAALTNQEEHPAAPRAADPNDPQGPNCPGDRGGERGKGALNSGSDVAGVIFEITGRSGFNAPHPATPPAAQRTMSHPPYPVAQNAASGGQHLHAVKARTNAEGEAGVIFAPSRCGGDRYRIRVYVGPDSLKGPGSDGTGSRAVRAETGTLVVWRNLKISRYIRQPANNPSPVLLSEANKPPYNITNNVQYLQRVSVIDGAGVNQGLPTADFSAMGTVSAPFEGIRRQWARAFVEVEIDRAAQDALPEIMSQAQWQAARQTALQDGMAGLKQLSLNLNLPVLFHMEPGSTITVNDAVVNLPMRTPEAYNAHPGVTAAQKINVNTLIVPPSGTEHPFRTAMNTLTMVYVLNGFLRSLSNNGFEPGVTVIQGTFGNTWQLLGRLAGNSGVALNYRGCFVWLGAAAYPKTVQPPVTAGMTYDYTSNTCHEIGHCCFRTHAPGFRPGGGPPGAANARRHDVQTNNENICVMSYQDCEGQFCAICLFSFRGWDEKTLYH